jgi:hypothetical protein
VLHTPKSSSFHRTTLDTANPNLKRGCRGAKLVKFSFKADSLIIASSKSFRFRGINVRLFG